MDWFYRKNTELSNRLRSESIKFNSTGPKTWIILKYKKNENKKTTLILLFVYSPSSIDLEIPERIIESLVIHIFSQEYVDHYLLPFTSVVRPYLIKKSEKEIEFLPQTQIF